MRAVLEFNLPEETEDFKVYQDAYKYKAVIDELFQFIRSQEKHTETRSIKWQDLRDKLVDLMDNNELEL